MVKSLVPTKKCHSCNLKREPVASAAAAAGRREWSGGSEPGSSSWWRPPATAGPRVGVCQSRPEAGSPSSWYPAASSAEVKNLHV